MVAAVTGQVWAEVCRRSLQNHHHRLQLLRPPQSRQSHRQSRHHHYLRSHHTHQSRLRLRDRLCGRRDLIRLSELGHRNRGICDCQQLAMLPHVNCGDSDSPWSSYIPLNGFAGLDAPSGLFTISSGVASALRISYAAVPGTSPYAGVSGSIFSAMILGIRDPPGVDGREPETRDVDRDRVPSGTTSISSGTASAVLSLYAVVPGTSPYAGSSSTLSTLVTGMGDWSPVLVEGRDPSVASTKSSLPSDDSMAPDQRRNP